MNLQLVQTVYYLGVLLIIWYFQWTWRSVGCFFVGDLTVRVARYIWLKVTKKACASK